MPEIQPTDKGLFDKDATIFALTITFAGMACSAIIIIIQELLL